MKDPDTYWHVMTGRWIIAHGDVPRVDVFSHTAAGTPWIDGEWLSQVVMAVTYDHAGWLGLQALLIACVVATYAIICTFLMHVYPRWVSAVVSVGAIYFALFHLQDMRPHVLAMPLLALWTGLLSQSRGNIWLLCALMVLWANVHGSFILGIAIAAGIGYVSMAVLAAALACINPYGYLLYETVWFQIAYMDVMRQQILELRPINAYDDMVQVIGLLVAAAVALWRGTKLGFRRAFTLCTILFFGLQNRRGLAFFGVTAPLIVAYSPRFSGSLSIPGRNALSDLTSRFNVHSTTE